MTVMQGTRAAKRWTLLATVLGSAMVFLDSTVVNVALPRIGQELQTPLFGILEAQSYVYNGYLLTLSALLVLAGALNDFYGRRRMFAVGLVGFGLTSALCGIAPTMELLIIFRILQGATGALLVPGSLSILTAAFKGEEQGQAFGIWAGASAGTTILGPFIGGALVDSISWRAAFLINVPLAALALWATVRHVAESRDEEASRRFDWLGAVVVALAVGGLSFGAIRGQERQWQEALPFIALAVGAAATIALPFLMTKRPHPLVPPHLFRSRNFTVTNISTLAIYGALYVTFYFLPIFLQGTLRYNATAAGLASVPGLVFLALFSSRFGALAGRYGPRWFMAAGPAIMGLGSLWFLRVSSNGSPWQVRLENASSLVPPPDYLTAILPGVIIFGLGAMVMVAPLTTCLMTSVPVRNSGLASAINNAISRVGPQLAGALIFVAVTATFYSGLQARVEGVDFSSPQVRAAVSPLNRPAEEVPADVVEAAREESTQAFHLAMLASAALLFAGAIINGAAIRNPTPTEVEARLQGTVSGEATV
ncbi:MAG: MFS transporter [Actinomycetota bacterium]|nr:MFS transporter [Actinomycetota bacterium]